MNWKTVQENISRMEHVIRVRNIENTVSFIICLIKVPEKEKRENTAELFETLIADKFPEVTTETNLPVQESL